MRSCCLEAFHDCEATSFDGAGISWSNRSMGVMVLPCGDVIVEFLLGIGAGRPLWRGRPGDGDAIEGKAEVGRIP
jgi:hypothetical protein